MRSSLFAVAKIGCTLAVLNLSCGSPKKPNTDIDHPGERGHLVATADLPPGLAIRVQQGEMGPLIATGDDTEVASATPLAKDRVRALLARLPALIAETGDEKPFRLRTGSRPPPRTGETIEHTFPPPPGDGERPPTEAAGALEVLRHLPEGDVPLAPHLSVTFSQPMVAVTAHGDASKTVPVKLDPQPAGNWRWIGTRTVLFDPEVRFPQATTYKVTVPAGTKSATGGVLANDVSWSFSTPPATLKRSYPLHSHVELKPVLFAAFDQAIDADAILEHVTIEAGGEQFSARLATDDELAHAKPMVGDLIAHEESAGHENRYLTFTVTEPLPRASRVVVTFDAGTPSAEGPRVTEKAQSFSFNTYGPFTILEGRCGWRGECRPEMPWRFKLSNPVDGELFDPALVTIEPPVPSLDIRAAGAYLSVTGLKPGRTTYRVTVSGKLTDTFGQKLGEDQTFTFEVGDPYPRVFATQGIVAADPADAKPSYSVHSTGFHELDVQIRKVTPADFPAFSNYLQKWRYKNPPPPPGTVVYDEKIAVAGSPAKLVETAIDLAPALEGGHGHAIVIVTPIPPPGIEARRRNRQQLHAWVQVTDIGVDAFSDGGELLAWTTRLSDGKPLEGVNVSFLGTSASASSDATGLATLPLPNAAAPLLVAKKGGDTAILQRYGSYWSRGGWQRSSQGVSLAWYVFDDRGLYKPGERVHFKGWMRKVDDREGGDVVGFDGAAERVRYIVTGPRGNELTKGNVEVTALGGFAGSFELPDDVNLGTAQIRLEAKRGSMSGQTYHTFQIQEFRRPEFEVSSEASAGPHMVGTHADVAVHAKYYSGGPLIGAPVNWQVTSSPTTFTPPDRDDYQFGHHPGWFSHHRYGPRIAHPPTTTETFSGETDATGTHVLDIEFVSANPPVPMSVNATGVVTDVNRQRWSTTESLLVHPAAVYVGIKSKLRFVERGKPIDIEGVIVDHDGKLTSGKHAVVRAVRLDHTRKSGQYEIVEVDPQTCEATQGEDPFECSFSTEKGGVYRIYARVEDDKGRPSETLITVYVTGGERIPSRRIEQEEVQLVPDKDEYAGGETAKVLVAAPFAPAEGLLTIRRSGIVESRRFSLSEQTTTLEIPIRAQDTPNIHVQVDLVGEAPRLDDEGEVDESLPPRPAYASGRASLSIPPADRELAIAVNPAARKLAPGSSSQVAITVRDASGNPVKDAEVALIVVDEAIWALTNHEIGNPLDAFYHTRSAGAVDRYFRSMVVLARPDTSELADKEESAANKRVAAESVVADMAAPAPAPAGGLRRERDGFGTLGFMSGEGAIGGAPPPIAVRKDFSALAHFSPAVQTDSRGRATVPIEVPDNLTRYRVVAVAAADKRQFGHGESSITARLPIMVRPSPPRFLNFGDTFELPVVVHNQTDEPLTIDVAVRATNVALTDGQGRQVKVEANDRVEIRFPAATEMAGTARFQFAASAGSYADAAELALPVWTPATTEAFATYGSLDEQRVVRQPVAMPTDVFTQFGGLEVTTSSTQLQAVTDAFIYLVDYPFECSEQMSSRILAIAALRDVLDAFDAEGLPSTAEIEAAVTRDLARLSGLQNHDGGFAFWRYGQPSWPYLTVHVAHALVRAEAKGYDVPDNVKKQALNYLENIESHFPSYYGPRIRRIITAYALYVRDLAGDTDTAKARSLIAAEGLDGLSMEAIGWVLAVLANDSGSAKDIAAIHRYLQNKVAETAATAAFTTHYTDGEHLILHSSRRADAVILDALIEDSPKSDLIPKLVRGLLGHRKRGRWSNTQDNVFVLLAMDRYFHAYENVRPNFVARVWLGDGLAGQHRFRGRETTRHRIDIPMSFVAKAGETDLTIGKRGRGRLYYRIGMTYAPEDLTLDPADHGFAVERTYEAIDDPKDVVRKSDGTWVVRAGARVRVRVTMVAQSRRYHVALVDKLPAGFEVVNPALAVSEPIPQDPSQKSSSYWWWMRPWYEHQNLRDERVEAFASLLWAGAHEYTYVVRATTPGNFVVPPAKAEEMYHPETFGRSASTRVIVK